MPLQKQYYLTIPLNHREMSPVFVVVEQDVQGNKLIITLTHDGQPFDLTGASNVTFTCLKADGNAVVDTATILDAKAGKISYVLHQQCLTYPGIVRATVEVYSDNGAARITSTQFSFEVRGQLNDGSAVPSQEEYPVLQQLLVDLNTAESQRVAAENARVSAENTRIANENARLASENTRESNEAARISAESSRASAESARATAESGRVTAESGRVTAENARVSAENTRVSNENIRETNEANRVTAESDRVTAENTRISNENTRIANENTRISNEAARQAAIGNLVTKGEYNPSTTYQPRNIVTYYGSSYIAKQETTGNAPTNSTYWQLIAQKGEKGATLSPRGAYDPLVNYTFGDVVSYQGDAYYCLQACQGIDPSNATYWAYFLEGGVSEHNALSGLNSGDYLHLTAAEKAAMETQSGAQTKADAAQAAAQNYADAAVNALAGVGNTKTVKQIDDTITAHLADNMPHRAPDPSTGKVYRWGLAIQNGEWGIIYEEVV